MWPLLTPRVKSIHITSLGFCVKRILANNKYLELLPLKYVLLRGKHRVAVLLFLLIQKKRICQCEIKMCTELHYKEQDH